MSEFRIRVPVAKSLLHPDYNHVHHADLLRVLEAARLRLLDEIGQPNDRLLAEGMALVISRIEVAYRREVKGPEIDVTCEEGVISGREIVLVQRLLLANGKEAVRATVGSMFLSRRAGRGVHPPASFREPFERYFPPPAERNE
jgi:acyl-CoA thioesterase FadM